jgi:hypothetical protein
VATVAEELQVKMQTLLCQAPQEMLRAMAKDFQLDISEQRKGTIVCMNKTRNSECYFWKNLLTLLEEQRIKRKRSPYLMYTLDLNPTQSLT